MCLFYAHVNSLESRLQLALVLRDPAAIWALPCRLLPCKSRAVAMLTPLCRELQGLSRVGCEELKFWVWSQALYAGRSMMGDTGTKKC